MTNLGNPAPCGLLAFGMTTLMLMFVDAGWAEKDFGYVVSAYAIFFGGFGQVLVAIFELMKGSSFSFAVFFSYGSFWLGWAFIFVERTKDYSNFQFANYKTGMTLFLIQWGLLSTCFWVITLRKNVCLITVFSLLCLTFYLLAAATATESKAVGRAAGYVGFLTAVGALYTGVAELINEEWGRHVLPGLRPVLTPERFMITKENIKRLTAYDKNTNSMFLQFSGLNVYRHEDVENIRNGVAEAIMEAVADRKEGDKKVHVIVDYKDVSIAKELEQEYWQMTRYMEKNYYLSVRRFAVSSFGTKMGGAPQQRSAAADSGPQCIGNNANKVEETVKAEDGSA